MHSALMHIILNGPPFKAEYCKKLPKNGTKEWRRTYVRYLAHVKQLLKVGGEDHGIVCYAVSCMNSGVQINLLGPVGVAADIQVQVEVDAVPISKDQLQNALDALGMDDEVDNSHSDGG